jgi:hypothetical protein
MRKAGEGDSTGQEQANGGCRGDGKSRRRSNTIGGIDFRVILDAGAPECHNRHHRQKALQ